MGIILSALGGAGEGLMQAGRQYGDYVARSKLQEEAEIAQRARDERLAALKEQSDIRAEERKRAPYRQAATSARGLIESAIGARNPVAVDDDGNPMPQAGLRREEEAALRARAYDEAGLPEAAAQFRREGAEAERLGLDRERLDRTDAAQRRDDDRADRQLDENIKHQRALERFREEEVRLRRITEGRLAAAANVQAQIAGFELKTKERLFSLSNDMLDPKKSPEDRAKAERDLLLLTGKAKEIPEPQKIYFQSLAEEAKEIRKLEASGVQIPPDSARRLDEIRRLTAEFARTGRIDTGGGGRPEGGAAPSGGRSPISDFFSGGSQPERPDAVPPSAGARPQPRTTGSTDSRRVNVPGMGMMSKAEIPERLNEFLKIYRDAASRNDIAEMQRVGRIMQDLKTAEGSPGI